MRSWIRSSRRCVRFGLGLVLLAGSGCVTEAGRMGMPSDATQQEMDEAARLGDVALDSFLQRDVRVQRVSQRLRIAGAPLCEGELSPVLGLALGGRKEALGSLGLFDPPGIYEVAAERRFRDTRPQVLEVFPDLPAARAGVQKGDVLLSIDGASVRDRYEADRATSSSSGSLELGLERDGKPLTLTLERVPGCAYPSYLVPLDIVNAFAYPPLGITAYTSALVRELRSDTQLALVIGHEMGHNIIGRLKAAAPTGSQDNEARADYIGAYMTATAGYPLSSADTELFDVLTRGDPNGVGGQGGPRSHPLSSARTLALKRVVAEIAAKQERGEPLRPQVQ